MPNELHPDLEKYSPEDQALILDVLEKAAQALHNLAQQLGESEFKVLLSKAGKEFEIVYKETYHEQD